MQQRSQASLGPGMYDQCVIPLGHQDASCLYDEMKKMYVLLFPPYGLFVTLLHAVGLQHVKLTRIM